MRSFPKHFVVPLLACLFLLSCTTTKLTRTWADRSYSGPPFSDLLVIGVSEDEDIRRSFENKFVNKLKATGVQAVSGASVITGHRKWEKEVIVAEAKRLGVDGVLMTHLVGVQKKEVASPSSTYNVPDDYHGGYYQYYSSGYDYTHRSQYYTTRVKIRLETNLYDAKTEKIVWTARSRTLNPKEDTALFDSVINGLIKDLKKNELIP